MLIRSMIQRLMVVLTCVGFLSALAAVLVLSVSSSSVQDANREKAARNLERLRGRYAAINSVHLAADVKIVIYDNPIRVGNGSYEYWAEGERYRIKCLTDRHLGLKTDFDVAYDGRRFYLLDHRLGVLSFRQNDEMRSQVALPNPLFLPVDYLSNDDDDCLFCALRLPDLKAENERWLSRTRSLNVKSERKDGVAGVTTSEFEMPGGKLNNRPYKIRMRATELKDGNLIPRQIDRIASDGKTLTSISFDNFMATSLGQFPQSILAKAFDDDGNMTLQAEFTVKTLRVNEPVENSRFTINFDEAEGVWDSDQRRFVKEKRVKPLRSSNQ